MSCLWESMMSLVLNIWLLTKAFSKHLVRKHAPQISVSAVKGSVDSWIDTTFMHPSFHHFACLWCCLGLMMSFLQCPGQVASPLWSMHTWFSLTLISRGNVESPINVNLDNLDFIIPHDQTLDRSIHRNLFNIWCVLINRFGHWGLD